LAFLAAETDFTAQASEAGQSSETTEQLQSTEQQTYVFGNWGGLRNWLSNHGVDLDLSYLSESAWDVAGGKSRGGTYAGQENLKLDLDGEKLVGLNGFSTHIDVVSRQGQNVSSQYVGDILFQAQQIYGSPAVEAAYIHLGYLYFEQKLFDDNVDLKAGTPPRLHAAGTDRHFLPEQVLAFKFRVTSRQSMV
jgi:carbohydrate-selective porin OprB